jgi:hypothetical protein
MDCKYRLYVPPSNDLLPQGLTWEPCTTDLVGPDTFDCRQVAVDWPTDIETPYALAGVSPGYVEEDGRVVLQVRKAHLRDGMSWQKEAAFMGLVVEADGPVRQAFWMDYDAYQSAPMILNNLAVAPGKSTWAAVEWHDMNVTRRASFGGDDTDLSPPILLDRLEDSPDAAIAYAGANYWLQNGRAELRVIGWDGIDHGVLAGVTAAVSPATWAGDALLWAYESNPTYRLWTWTKQDGSRELTPFGSDLSKGAGNPGTDGKDLVWVQGEDRMPSDEWFPTRSIMTAPFTTDPAELQPRRLRSWVLAGIGTSHRPPVVGCGHAALISWNKQEGLSLLIVRLSDGRAWQLRGPPAPAPHWYSPVAITCDEVFAIFEGSPMWSLRRVRLDSLGPGMPAD